LVISYNVYTQTVAVDKMSFDIITLTVIV